jgi:ankyrin repeat protein
MIKIMNGYSPIIWASDKGHASVAKLFLSKGANPNDKRNNGTSPIICTSEFRHASIVELLLSKGADILI